MLAAHQQADWTPYGTKEGYFMIVYSRYPEIIQTRSLLISCPCFTRWLPSLLSIQLTQFELPRVAKQNITVSTTLQTSPEEIAEEWQELFCTFMASDDASKLREVIYAQGRWRDHLAVSWKLRTVNFIIVILCPVITKIGSRNI
jgi:hypothetical protein